MFERLVSLFRTLLAHSSKVSVLGFKNPQLSGKVSGNIKYSANDYKTSVNMNFKKGTLFEV